MNAIINSPSIEDLANEWIDAKDRELAAQARRREIEAQMLDLVEVPLGSTVNAGPLSVSVREKRVWDQDHLEELHFTYGTTAWPFKLEWKEDRKLSRALEELAPDVWVALRTALTVTPARPSWRKR